ncbi:MAG: SDR family oxidoreductase [Anaerolineae bacterium]|nr:SDR family oxidoreductase [Anaerolineae bacterium]
MMKGKTVIVTGATSGIGEVTALELARQGATVVVISRSAERCAATVQRIQMATNNPQVSYIAADLSSLAEMHRAADEFLAQHARLDVLVNNAGAFFNDFRASADGYEMTFALNHLSYFVLTHRLLPVLKSTAATAGEARIINVSSDAHQVVRKLDFASAVPRKSSAGFTVYGESKYMNVLFSYELAERLAGTGVTVNALHPGFVRTGFGKNNGGIIATILGVLQQFIALTPEQGAATTIYLASAPEAKGVTGKYFSKQKAVRSSSATYDREAWRQLWQQTAQLVGLATV